MASKNESTAINKLIDLVNENQKTSKPVVHPDDDLFAQPPPKQARVKAPTPAPLPEAKKPKRAAKGTSRLGLYDNLPVATNPSARMTPAPTPRGNTIPPLPSAKRAQSPSVLAGKPITATFSAVTVPSRMPDATPAPELAHQHRLVEPKALATVAPLSYPVVQRPATIDMTKDAPWFEVTPSQPAVKFDDETYVGTSPHVKQDRERERFSLAKKLVLPGVGFIILGAMIGGFIAFNGDKKPAKAAAPAPAAAPQKVVEAPAPTPAAAPVATAPAPVAAAPTTEIQTTRGVVQLADVRIDSKPSGATVTLVDEKGKSTVIGSTPIAASVDPNHQYDITLALGAKTQTVHLDPAKDDLKLSIDLGGKTAPAPKHEMPAPAPAPAPKHEVAAPAPKHEVHHAVAAVEKAPADAGEGTLMISSKPPCEIYVDGKATGLSTPQRAMSLPVGAHKITLKNAAENVDKTMMVQINANQSTKLVKDLLAP
ncbi:MAG: PEGA domain-containing protein [Kofleriaceae bacterium]